MIGFLPIAQAFDWRRVILFKYWLGRLLLLQVLVLLLFAVTRACFDWRPEWTFILFYAVNLSSLNILLFLKF